jgi:hypothetical protein
VRIEAHRLLHLFNVASKIRALFHQTARDCSIDGKQAEFVPPFIDNNFRSLLTSAREGFAYKLCRMSLAAHAPRKNCFKRDSLRRQVVAERASLLLAQFG